MPLQGFAGANQVDGQPVPGNVILAAAEAIAERKDRLQPKR